MVLSTPEVLGYIRKQAEPAMRSIQHFSVASASVPVSRFLPSVPSLTSLSDEFLFAKNKNKINSLLPKFFFWGGQYFFFIAIER